MKLNGKMKTMNKTNLKTKRQQLTQKNFKTLANKAVELCPILGLNETGLPIVAVFFKKILLYFVLDSGAHQNVLDIRVYNALKDQLKSLPSQGNIVGFEGQHIDIAQRFSMKFSLQNHYFEEEFSAMEIPGFDYMATQTGVRVHGILGSAFFTRHNIILDYNLAKLYKARNKQSSHAQLHQYAELFPLLGIEETGLPFVMAYHKDVLLQFFLDTGGQDNILDTAVSDQLKDQLKHIPIEGGKLVGFEGQQHETGCRLGMRFEISGQTFNDDFTPMHIPGFDYVEENFGVHLDGLLGSEFAINQKLIIDYSQQMIYRAAKNEKK